MIDHIGLLTAGFESSKQFSMYVAFRAPSHAAADAFMLPPWLQVPLTTQARGCVLTAMPTATLHLSSTRTAITSKQYATKPDALRLRP